MEPLVTCQPDDAAACVKCSSHEIPTGTAAAAESEGSSTDASKREVYEPCADKGAGNDSVVLETQSPCGIAEEADAEDETCAICLERIDTVGDSVALPCACPLFYHPRCWDRSLAQSMTTTGLPRCPTCRVVLRVDYDATTAQLVFSTSEELQERNGDTANVLHPDNDTRARLCEQAKPRQRELLQLHRTARASGDVEEDSAPSCVCGGEFICLPLRQRVHRLVEPHDDSGTLLYSGRRLSVDFLIKAGTITCDLCGARQREENTKVWTCVNGQATVLHAHSYDVCLQCYDGEVVEETVGLLL
mmetsp:Transcript_21826/g.49699  ORF Transcript_21826/g.49699 Transcript_21826/m.49699 type:complete len:303 (+) Transcript_21826:149-1057(+)